MGDELAVSLTAVAARLAALAGEDAELRQHLRRLAAAILDATEEAPRKDAVEEASAEHVATKDNGGSPAPPAEPATTLAPTPAPGFERIAPVEPAAKNADEVLPPAHRWAEVADAELPLIETRCRLKADGARWAATRRRRLAAGVDYRVEIEPLDREIIERAKKLPECFLWMCHPSGPSPSDLSLFEDVAGCFDAVASGVALLRSLLEDLDGQPMLFEQALDLLAEAQSALRAGIMKLGGGTDADQQKAFHWLRSTGNKHQIFIQRFMRVDDPADPSGWADISDRIQAVDSALQESRQRQKRQQQSLGRIRYHLGQLARDNGDGLHHWNAVVQSVEGMVQDGVPPSNTALRELLIPLIDGLPEMELPPGFRLVMREIDRYLATRTSSEADEAAAPMTDDVKAVAQWLAGKTLVLIGGVRRPHAHDALKATFGLKEVDWIETNEHESISVFEPHVARPDVALVLLAIRWSSHVFGEVKQFCDRYNKPLVRLPAGYNPNQVAVQIITQASERLRNGT